MMPIPPFITAVVVTHNRPELLKLVVCALQNQTFSPTKILVVDNASTHPAASVLSDFSGVDVIRSEENTGGAGGFSLGLEHALSGQADWVWLMDDDAVPAPDALEYLIDAARTAPLEVGALCPLVEEFGCPARFHHRRFNFLNGNETEVSEDEIEDVKLVEIDTGSFVGFFISRRVAQVIGLPISELFIGYDDTEYCLRLRSAGFLLFLVTASRMVHLTQKSSALSNSVFGPKHYFHIRNQLYVKKIYTSRQALGIWSGVVTASAIWLSSKERFSFSSLSLFSKAIIDGIFSRLGRGRAL